MCMCAYTYIYIYIYIYIGGGSITPDKPYHEPTSSCLDPKKQHTTNQHKLEETTQQRTINKRIRRREAATCAENLRVW